MQRYTFTTHFINMHKYTAQDSGSVQSVHRYTQYTHLFSWVFRVGYSAISLIIIERFRTVGVTLHPLPLSRILISSITTTPLQDISEHYTFLTCVFRGVFACLRGIDPKRSATRGVLLGFGWRLLGLTGLASSHLF